MDITEWGDTEIRLLRLDLLTITDTLCRLRSRLPLLDLASARKLHEMIPEAVNAAESIVGYLNDFCDDAPLVWDSRRRRRRKR